MPAQETSHTLPFVKRLPEHWNASLVFDAIRSLPGRLWLDSANVDQTSFLDPAGRDLKALSRYSFLTADPIYRISAGLSDPNPWLELEALVGKLPDTRQRELPPFQGGVAGVIGYESAMWLEREELDGLSSHQKVDFPVPVFSMGLYDWTIAFDHQENSAWLISQGFQSVSEIGLSGRTVSEQAERRAKQIFSLIENQASTAASPPPSGKAQSVGGRLAGVVSSDFTGEAYRDAVATIVERIKSGAAFQVNLSQRLTVENDQDPAVLYKRLREANPAPFAGFYDGGDFQVLSSSPEGFLKLRDRRVETRPIKGTIPRSSDELTSQQLAERLMSSDKDRAENIMIVDLMRNDLSQVCLDDSVIVSQLCKIERYQFVQHLVSVVEGQLREDATVVDLLKACFPGGSVTGAPKIEAMRMIAELEKHPRGPYCGSMGYVSCGGDSDFNILIRTMTATQGHLQFPVGGGITARSQPGAEETETWDKAAGMLKAIEAHQPSG